MNGINKTKGGKYQVRYFAGHRENGTRICPSKTFDNFNEAVEWHKARKLDRDPCPLTLNAYPDGWIEKSYKAIRHAANHRSIGIDLTFDQYKHILEKAEGKCSLTGIRFNFGPVKNKHARRPFAPSLDRIDSRKGYTASNCRVVCCAVNFALGDWGLDTLMHIARNLVSREQELEKFERRTSQIRLAS